MNLRDVAMLYQQAGLAVLPARRAEKRPAVGAWRQYRVHVATDLTEAQVKAYRIADNQTAAIAEWDYELLPIELSSLQEMNFDLGLLGFDQEELARLMSGDVEQGLTDPDDVPAPPDAATTQPGDLWILGNHRLLCGDSSTSGSVDLDNHWLDCLVGCAVAASMQGCVLFGTDTKRDPNRPRLKLSTLQRRSR